MSDDCDHGVEDVARIDTDGLVLHDDGTIESWAECECGAATIVRATIDSVELDSGDGPTYGGDDAE